jgi:hypothetical protein
MEFPPLYAGDSERRDVCFGSLADTALRPRHVRYSPQSGTSAQFARPLSAISGHWLDNMLGGRWHPQACQR